MPPVVQDQGDVQKVNDEEDELPANLDCKKSNANTVSNNEETSIGFEKNLDESTNAVNQDDIKDALVDATKNLFLEDENKSILTLISETVCG
ncbi:hypothetical protein FQR65_LT07098 [Abscondita terminalis]|nr:hypothetical protein FQR65_LT07098 [Abscondita terminalis]